MKSGMLPLPPAVAAAKTNKKQIKRELGVTPVLETQSFTFKLATTVLLLVAASYAGVSVSSPTNGSTVGSPVHVVASSTSSNPITAMKVYVDNNIAYSVSTASIDTYLSMASGTRYITVQSWDSAGLVQKNSFAVSVSGSTTTTPDTTSTTSTTPKFSNIQTMTGWQNCGACAGPGGTGPTVPYSMTQFISSPSMTGKAAQFWIGGSTRYAQALWWKQLGPNDAAYNFVYDVYFYLKDPNAPQALEFDVNQSLNGIKYIFGTECSLKQTGTWRVWDTKNSYWVNTGVACPNPQAYTWNHLTWELKRVGSQTQFVAVTLNGVKHYINKYFYSRASSGHEISVAFQMDENGSPTQYSTWLDKVSLNYW